MSPDFSKDAQTMESVEIFHLCACVDKSRDESRAFSVCRFMVSHSGLDVQSIFVKKKWYLVVFNSFCYFDDFTNKSP